MALRGESFDVGTRARKAYLRASAAATALVAASLLPALPPAPAGAQTATVQMVNIAYNPSTITIPVGGTVTWVNQDSAPHTATDDHNAWSSPLLNTGDTYSQTFDHAGVVTYYCVVHPGQMKGTIIVGGSATAQPTAQSTTAPGTPEPSTTTPSAPVTPSPTAVTIPSVYPSASQLYDGSLRALRSARGYSISETAVQSRVGKKQTFTLAGVVAAPSSEERLTLRVTARRGRTSQTDIVEIKASAWIKRASVDRTWKRVNASRVDSLLGPLRNPLTEGSGSSVSRLKTVGPATFHGVSVWHVRWTESRGSLSGTVDALIAKKGFLPYRTIRSLVGGATKAHLADRITRSRFGERTHIRPPTG